MSIEDDNDTPDAHTLPPSWVDPAADRLTQDGVAGVLEQYAPMAWKLAHHLHAKNRDIPAEDIHAAVRLGFVRAAVAFRPSLGWKFSTSACTAGWRDAVAFILKERQRGLTYLPQGVFASAVMGEVSAGLDADRRGGERGGVVGDGVVGDSPCERDDFWRAATAELRDKDLLVILGYYRDGKDFIELGRELGVSKQRVQQIHHRAVERVRRLGAKRLGAYMEAA